MFARVVWGWVGGFAVLLLAGGARAGFSIVSQSADVNASAGVVTFTVTFDQEPDWIGRDVLGRPDDSFQYEIAPDAPRIRDVRLGDLRAIVRGDEIGTSDLIPIRDGFENGHDPSPAAGGWGGVRGSVPFKLQGDTLTFAAPLRMLDAPGGHFAYRVFTTHYGALTSEVDAAIIPTPTALDGALICGLLCVPVLRRLRRAG